MTFVQRCTATDVGGAQCSLATGHQGEHQLPAAPALQQNMAGGLLEIEKLRAKLIPFRIAGLVTGGAIWWFVVGPMAGTGNPLVVLVSLPILAVVGLYLGNIIGLSLLRR